MSKETIKRIFSAIVLLIILVVTLSFGQMPALILIYICGGLLIHELLCNFIKFKKFGKEYFINIVSYSVIYFFVILEPLNSGLFRILNNAGIIINVSLLFYLFLAKQNSKILVLFFRRFRYFIGALISILILNISNLLFYNNWLTILIAIFLLNFSVDTAAWFFGKNFGKHKLWEKVSPKKTIEGAIGGALSSVILTSLYWRIFISDLTLVLVLGFLILSILSQFGDLVQSKIKRGYNIKDSSNLIPGHGGVYDRLDSLIFVTPFYIYLIYVTTGY